jgi:hypothetical protein
VRWLIRRVFVKVNDLLERSIFHPKATLADIRLGQCNLAYIPVFRLQEGAITWEMAVSELLDRGADSTDEFCGQFENTWAHLRRRTQSYSAPADQALT